MPLIFFGGEDHDLQKIGSTGVDTATVAARRTANARCALRVGFAAADTDGWRGAFSSAASAFWLTARMYSSMPITAGTTGNEIMSFLDGTTKRLRLRPSSNTALAQTWVLSKVSAAGVDTPLATASIAASDSTLIKVDVHVTYAVAGQIDVYFDGVLAISYTGDVTTDSATTLSSFTLGIGGSQGGHAAYWSEIIAYTTEDTRSMGLVTMPLAANGNTFNFTSGSYADLDEVVLNDSDIATSALANQLAQATVDSSGIAGNPAIRAVCVSARAQKGGTGPANAELNVRTSAADYFSGSIALPASLQRIANVWELNPATSGAWAHTDLTAAGFNVGMKSLT